MAWLNWFKASPKVIDDVFDKDSGHLAKIGGWIGNQDFTTEEQAEMTANIAKGVQKFAIDTLSENTERSKARRTIAENVINFYLIVLFMAGMTWVVDKEWSAMWLEIAMAPGLALLVIGVAGFFFGVHTLRGMGKAK